MKGGCIIMNDAVQIIISGAVIALGVTGAFLISSFATYWRAKKDSLKQMIAEDEKLQKIPFLDYLFDRVANVVDDVVGALNSTFKKELVEATQDGKLTKEDGKLLRDKAVELIKGELSDSVWDELQIIVGDTDEFLKTLIEKKVEEKKVTKVPSAMTWKNTDDDEDDDGVDIE